MGKKDNIQGYYNPKTGKNKKYTEIFDPNTGKFVPLDPKSEEYQSICDNYQPVDLGGAENPNPKKKKSKALIIAAAVIGLVVIGSVGDSDDKETETASTTETSYTTEYVESDTAKTTIEEFVETEIEFAENSIYLTAGEQGEYGKLVTMNKGTEFEENFYAYYVPYGTYKVTNIDKYQTQVGVYTDETVINENGWEEIADALHADVVKPSESITITVPPNYHVDIPESSKIVLELIEEYKEAETTAETVPLFDYDVKYISHKVDYSGEKPVLLVTYEFSNTSGETRNWTTAITDRVFQNGIECNDAYFHDDITSDMKGNRLKQGATVTIVDGYILYDAESPVTIECYEFLGDEPMFVIDIELVE